MKNKFTYCILFLVLTTKLVSQNVLEIDWIQSDEVLFPKRIKLEEKLEESKLDAELLSLVYQLRSLGYLGAAIDSTIKDSLSVKVYFYLGEEMSLHQVLNGNIEEDFWKKIKTKAKTSGLSPLKLLEIQNDLLIEYENKSYPFAELYLDSIEIQNGEISAYLFVNKHDQIFIDSVFVFGDTKTKPKFLQRYLGIQSGDPYNQQKINGISKKLKQLGYLLESKSSELFFTKGQVSVSLFLQKQRSSQFNLLLGILPNDQIANKKVTISGEGKLKLQNFFGVGEEIFVEFEQLKARTQNLTVSFKYPYILNSPIGVYGGFALYKNDSLFIDIKSELGLLYQFAGFNRLKLFYKNQSSNVLNADTNAIKTSGQLPSILDMRNNSYGAAIELQQLDYVLNPVKGYMLVLGANVGSNKIKVNQSIAALRSFDGSYLQNKYDQMNLKKINYGLNFQYTQFFPIRKRSTIMLQNKSAAYIAKNILGNEKFRIGGYKMMRGFDEEAIYTPFYSIFTSEFRFLLSKNSYFGVFSDFGLVENEQKGSTYLDFPIGFGAGVSLETKGGMFSLNYALGKNLDNKIQVRNGKIHFGFVSIF